MNPYTFNIGPDNLGVGVMNFAPNQHGVPVDSMYGPRYNVRASLGPTEPAYAKLGQNFVPVSLNGNGLYFSGDFLLNALIEFNRSASG